MFFRKNSLSQPQVMAAIDLGSNSFHMIIVRVTGQDIQVIDRLREMVRLGSGLDKRNRLNETTQVRALECLQRFAQRLADIPPANIRIVGTNTLRKAINAQQFLSRAEATLGHSIDIINGIEEARLIYLGVSHNLPEDEKRHLVIDIGGGSTELIIGERFRPITMESLFMGCVSMTKRFFKDGKISKKRLHKAHIHALLKLEDIQQQYCDIGWDIAIGASGSARAIAGVISAEEWSTEHITAKSLSKMKEHILACTHIDELKLNGLDEDRQPVFVGGYIVLHAIFEALHLKKMIVSDGALREGLIFEALGRINQEDVHQQTITNLCKRYHIDVEHADSVEQTALQLLNSTAKSWHLQGEEHRNLLGWAAQLHEMGLTIAHSSYHKHSAYLVEHSNMPAFTLKEQQILALIIRYHRRKINPDAFASLADKSHHPIIYLCILLRLAIKFQRSRSHQPLPKLTIETEDKKLTLGIPAAWIEEHPLTMTDLEHEKEYLKKLDFKLRLKPQ
ncbi:MAG: exopolyphosphatase [Gammaproteobacteria bacterium]|nr:exopolyphosphatase [Gammaproteobacteria bacterium]